MPASQRTGDLTSIVSSQAKRIRLVIKEPLKYSKYLPHAVILYIISSNLFTYFINLHNKVMRPAFLLLPLCPFGSSRNSDYEIKWFIQSHIASKVRSQDLYPVFLIQNSCLHLEQQTPIFNRVLFSIYSNGWVHDKKEKEKKKEKCYYFRGRDA